ncbi:MAG TPA: cytochrome c [Gammaproteobacteria bacterium]
MKTMACICLVACFVASAAAAADDNIAAGEQAYSSKGCMGCHGPAGNSPNPGTFPKTAGLEAAYIIVQLKAFRSGERTNPMMTPMVRDLSDQEISSLAAYLAVQK